MYAVVTTGGKQYKVSPGDTVRIEKLRATVGDTVELDRVSLVAKEDGLTVEPGALASATVIAEVIRHGRNKKIRVFKKKRRKGYARTYGHRQDYTELKIREIRD